MMASEVLAAGCLESTDAIPDVQNVVALIAEARYQGLRQFCIILGQQESHGG